MINKSTEGL